MDNNNQGKNWIRGLSIFFFFVLGMIIWTVIASFITPVNKEHNFMEEYEYVDKNINQLLYNEQIFYSKYNIKLITPNSTINNGKNELIIEVLDKKNNPIKDANITVILSKRGTQKLDETFNNIEFQNNLYKLSYDINSAGRWVINYKISIDKLSVYNKFKTFTKDTPLERVLSLREFKVYKSDKIDVESLIRFLN
jgi:hypothetical protein